MGYNTWYGLNVFDEGMFKQESKKARIAIKYLREYSEEAFEILEPGGDGEDWGRWYNFNADMYWISRLFPELIFALHGDGDEMEDLWVCYYVDGMEQMEYKISTPPFDRTKLKKVL